MEKRVYHYTTISKALEDLKEKGFTVDYNIQDSKIINSPFAFEIAHIYRYESESYPIEEAIVYGIRSNTGEKGVYVSHCSSTSENETESLLRELASKVQ